MGPVVSCEPTEVIFGSQYMPGSTPSPSGRPHARPTIFCASEKPFTAAASAWGRRNASDAGRPSDSRARPVRPRPMMSGMRPPAWTSSKSTSVFISNSDTSSSVPWRFTLPSYGKMSMVSFMWSSDTSHSNGRAPESSMVLKKMGAILPPMQTPPVRLFGTFGISSPMYQRIELVADLRDEPVPTTSPTYASGKPLALASSICAAQSWIPSRGFLSMARPWSGMSGRDHASGAGERSSVLVSPVTLNTVTVIFSATFGLLVNHSASAHDCITDLAYSLPACEWRL
mmetsp:Transcript_58184/g.161169  ORF Transcript_58184/g.161169 Transcript_58184/m.161169 type:complete len:285 (+) Transcript_58184:1694-2548(+)